ncbi:MAG: hypothetical protein DI591_11890 [Citromicrobium sp.]|nr:MAG: hypothetical protein DI591_11890 [Citromicrobium sp.]
MKNLFSLVTLVFLVLTVLIGGSSSQALPANALLQFLAAILIGWAIAIKPSSDDPTCYPSLRWVWLASALLIVFQFLPMPPAFWTRLPGRDGVADGFVLLDVALPWQTISMSPWASLGSLTWLLPAAALYFAVRSPQGPDLRALARVIVTLACASLALGVMQRVTGALYLYRVTNYGLSVGFFANANHHATFLVCALLFWVILYVLPDKRRGLSDAVRSNLFYLIALYLTIGVILCGSLAGTILLVLALVFAAFLLKPQWLARRNIRLGLFAFLIAGAAGSVYIGMSTSGFILDTDMPGMSRTDFWRNGLSMVLMYFPFGSGLGTFQELYPQFENVDLVGRTYVNHAHNDYLELLIETGVSGGLLIAAFGAWLVMRIAILRREQTTTALHGLMGVLGLIALHSLVDYPLRTAAIAAVFGLTIALSSRPVDPPRSRRGGTAPSER